MQKICSKALILLLVLALPLSADAQFLKTQRLREFKGLNTNTEEDDLPLTDSNRCENVRFNKYGSLEKRSGRAYFNTYSLGSSPINFLTRYYSTVTDTTVFGYDTTLLAWPSGASTYTTVKTGLTADLRYDDLTYKDVLYLCTGTDSNFRYSSGEVATWGTVSPFSAASVATTTGAGLSAGLYGYKYTFLYDGYQESNPSASSSIAVADVTDAQVVLSSIATGTGVTARKIYRTIASGTTHYYLATISDNTSTIYTDSTADSGLSTSVPPTDHLEPSIFKYIVTYKERIFGAGNPTYTSRLYFSKIESGVSLPDCFPATYYIDVSPDDGDKITGLVVDNSGILCILKRNSIRKLFANGSPNQWQLSDSFTNAGCIAPWTIQNTPEGVIYLSRGGDGMKELRLFNGQTSLIISDKIEPTLQNISDQYIENCASVFHDNKYYLSYTDSTGGTSYNNRVLVFDLAKKEFSLDTNKNIADFSTWFGGSDTGELYSSDSNAGRIYKENTSPNQRDLLLTTQDFFTNGTSTSTTVGGSFQQPEIYLNKTQCLGSIGAQVANTVTATASSAFTGEADTSWPSSLWESDPLYIGATYLKAITWREILSQYSNIDFWVRTGASEAACEAAAYSGPYSTPGGSSLTTVTANDYIQIKARFYLSDVSSATSVPPKLYRDDYVIKIDAGLGQPVEDDIYFVWQSGNWDFQSPLLRKRFRRLKIRHEANAQEYYLYYMVDDNDEQVASIDTSTYTGEYQMSFPLSQAFGERLRLRVEDNSTDEFALKQVDIIYTEEPYR